MSAMEPPEPGGNYNRWTLDAYEAHVEEYIAGTPHEIDGSIQAWLDRSLDGLDRNADILELGSGFGRDAAYIESLGYHVACTDAVAKFVEHLRAKGHDARELDVLYDDFGDDRDLILANAVLLHLTPDEFISVMEKVRDALGQDGRFAFTLKEGQGELWSTEKLGAPRYFCLWSKETIAIELHLLGFLNTKIETVMSGEQKWLHVVASKNKR